MTLRIDVTCPSGIIDINGNYVPVDPQVQCKPRTPGVAIDIGDILVDFATGTTQALGDAIVEMMKNEGVTSPLVTYNKIKVGGLGALGSYIDYQVTYSEVSAEYGGGLKAEIVSGGVVLNNMFFTAGVSAYAIQTAIGGALLAAAGPIVGGFAVAVGSGLLVSSLFGVEINGISIGGTFQDMFAGAYDEFVELGNFGRDLFKGAIPTFDDFIVDMAHGIEQMWHDLSSTISGVEDAISQAYWDFLDAVVQSLRIDPLIIDINGDGIVLDSFANSNALFDLNGDGVRENTGWTKANSDDSFLVIDKNSNGNIDDIYEMFGNATTAGFVDLKSYDSNAIPRLARGSRAANDNFENLQFSEAA